MMNFFSKISSLLIAILALQSCENALFDKDPEADPKSVFNYLWKEIDENYSYFKEKNIDWDSVYTVYNAKINNDLSQEETFDILAEMMNLLRDGHVNLVSSFNISLYRIEFDFEENFDGRMLVDYYLDKRSDKIHTQLDNGYAFAVAGGEYISGAFRNQVFNINDTLIGYVRYNDFTSTVTDLNWDYVLKNRMDTCKGIVIDVRSNGGGSPENLFAILKRLINTRAFMYNTYLKDGNDRDEFTAGNKVYLAAHDSASAVLKPVRILTNRNCYSATSFFAAAARSLAQQGYDIKLIGDYTGGGAGAPGGGQLPNGWQYRMSVTKSTIDMAAIDEDEINKGIIEEGMFDDEEFHFEAGVPPHIRVDSDSTGKINRDMILETAILDIFTQ
ncbi:MAG: S41 family peptidase [Bacteroidales bacterium]|nr:S41 family peptidase [Bacteroidales bacterium]